MNTQNVWIKRSEREPTEADLPIIGGAHILGGNKQWDEAYYQDPGNIPAWFTHWRSIKAEPPARELTQREVDKAMARNIAMVDEGTVTECVLEGIYAERREVAKLLTEYFGGDCWRDENKVPDMRDIAARLDEQGAK